MPKLITILNSVSIFSIFSSISSGESLFNLSRILNISGYFSDNSGVFGFTDTNNLELLG